MTSPGELTGNNILTYDSIVSNSLCEIDLLMGNTLPIHYFYNLCGTEYNIAYASANVTAKNLPAACNQFVEGDNFIWQEVSGVHDLKVWYLDFYYLASVCGPHVPCQAAQFFAGAFHFRCNKHCQNMHQ